MNDTLKDEDLIQPQSKEPFPIWLWLFFFAVLVIILSSIQNWYDQQMSAYREESPFLHVTNREFSLFLWENPQFMRVNVSSKEAYLPGFQYLEQVTVNPALADQLVSAPPHILFHYHTWKRLIGDEISPRVISIKEFRQFLDTCQEWKPEYWRGAPQGYIELINSLDDPKTPSNLMTLPSDILPLATKLSFIGWKNFFFEGEQINAMQPTYQELEAFLTKNPTFQRNYWRNLVLASDPNYLYDLTFSSVEQASYVPSDQMTPFLRVALFNFLQAKKGL